METWVLIVLTFTTLGASGIHHVPGFATEADCARAGKVLYDAGRRFSGPNPVRTICVRTREITQPRFPITERPGS